MPDNKAKIIERLKAGAGTSILGAEDFSVGCDLCGNPMKVHVGYYGDPEPADLCLDCYNRLMAEATGAAVPDILPKRLPFKGKGRKEYEFEIELLVFPTGKMLTATELGKTKRKVEVRGEPDADAGEMLETLKRRVKKALSVRYMKPDGYFAQSKAVGYVDYNFERDDHEVVIDGKPYTWAELEKNMSAHEGWQIKIEFGDVGDELD